MKKKSVKRIQKKLFFFYDGRGKFFPDKHFETLVHTSLFMKKFLLSNNTFGSFIFKKILFTNEILSFKYFFKKLVSKKGI